MVERKNEMKNVIVSIFIHQRRKKVKFYFVRKMSGINMTEKCLICLEKMVLEMAPKCVRGLKIECGHVFHAECIKMWLENSESCAVCRREIKIGSMDLPIEVENLNSPDDVLVELHKQFILLKILNDGKKKDNDVKYWFESVRLRYRKELEEWELSCYKQWREDQRFVKLLLVGNFVSEQEMNKDIDYFGVNRLESYVRCRLLQNERIVHVF